MGTNYYAQMDFCKECERFEEIHIGKSSCGWKFAIEIHELYYKDFKEFVEFIQKGDVKIRNEYGDLVSAEKLFDLIESKKKDKSHFKEFPDEPHVPHKEVDLHLRGFG